MKSDSPSDALPLYRFWSDPPDVEQLFAWFARQPYCLFLDSALRRPSLGRFSFLMADPFEVLRVSVSDNAAGQLDHAESLDGLAALQARLELWRAETIPGLPPFQGGGAGLLAYDLNRSLERIAAPRHGEFPLPAIVFGFYDVVLAIDHVEGGAWWISHGFPETSPDARRRRARERLEFFQRGCMTSAPETDFSFRLWEPPVPKEDLCPQYPVADQARGGDGQGNWGRLTSNFSPEAYREMVRRAVKYIADGDAFQINLAQRLLHPAEMEPEPLYLRLRRRNPATFSAYFDAGDVQILSASPERFLQVRQGRVEARPIKGTRQRMPHAEANLFAASDLLESQKDRAENVMIVDLLRNDLSAVCDSDSVCVTALCQLESYEYVQHLVSVVEGTLRDGATVLDLVRAAFPGGSITGAPKVRAMEIIAELEPTARGAYCGSLGYVGFDGSLDLNILIRTITAQRGWWQFPVGGGITSESDPQREYEETWHKAAGLLRAIEPSGGGRAGR
jgi:para-aminobenzoate synthetase component I